MRARNGIYCLLGLLVAVGVIFYVSMKSGIFGSAISAKNINHSAKVVAFGDSITFGVGAAQKEGYVSLLSQKLGMPIVNAGRGGDTTGTALARIEGVLAEDPDVVILMLGGNDYLSGVPKQTLFANLGLLIEEIQGSGAVVLLVGMHSLMYATDFEALAKKYDTAFVPNILQGLFGHTEYMTDSIHPNAKGYAIIADRLYPKLVDILNDI